MTSAQNQTASYGSSLWDNVNLIEQHSQDGLDFMNKLQDFMKKRAVIESEYAKAISKLVETSKDSLVIPTSIPMTSAPTTTGDNSKKVKKQESKINAVYAASNDTTIPTLLKSWATIMEQTEQTSKVHQAAANYIENDLINALKNQVKNFDNDRKSKLNEVKNLRAEFGKVMDSLGKTKKNYETACKVADDARIAMEKASRSMTVTKAQEDRLRDEASSKAKKAEEADEEFQKVLAITNSKQSQFYEKDLPKVLDGMQSIDEAGIDFLKDMESKYVSYLVGTQLPDLTKSYNKMTESVNAVDKSADSEIFINKNKSNAPLPEKIPYENIWEKLNGQKKKNEDDMLLESMSPEKAYKKAQAKVKELQKELDQAESKRSGIEVLAEAYLTTPQLADSKTLMDINNQLEDIETKIDTFRLKKYKYECFLATAEAKDLPAIPALYADGKAGPQATHLKNQILGSSKGALAAGSSAQSSSSLFSNSGGMGSSTASMTVKGVPEKGPSSAKLETVKEIPAQQASANSSTAAKKNDPKDNQSGAPAPQSNVDAKKAGAAVDAKAVNAADAKKLAEQQKKNDAKSAADQKKAEAKAAEQKKVDAKAAEAKAAEQKKADAKAAEAAAKQQSTAKSDPKTAKDSAKNLAQAAAATKSQKDLKTAPSAAAAAAEQKSQPAAAAQTKASEGVKYKTLFDFEGDAANEELPFKAGEILTVLEQDDSGWWSARNGAGKEGFIPHNYVEKV
ncbi:hypothetical protein MIR68_008003 [Amoeboaphelidium protococcarum]|nr:hypothetical protein MIR68_008003 [Amoeboaphelidium protococcarum]